MIENLAYLGEYQNQVDETLAQLTTDNIIDRIWQHDHTVWHSRPVDITNRLGWLSSPDYMKQAVPEIDDLVQSVRRDGFTHALLLGMGGSSLAPEVFRLTFGVTSGYLDLEVLDSTDPGAVLEKARRLAPNKTLYIVSTKSGDTVETISFMKYFYNLARAPLGAERVGQHFIAITDAGTGLEIMAKKLNFRKIYRNDANVGGRFSALTYFGLIPAALVGVDVARLLHRASTMASACNMPITSMTDNPAAWLGAILATLASNGRDKVTLVTSSAIASFATWIEQLIAESTGKNGKGMLPIAGEFLAAPEYYAHDRLFVYLRLENDNTFDASLNNLVAAGQPLVQIDLHDPYDLGGEFFRWELATAVACWKLGVNPFNQPDVESAKKLARQMVTTYQKEGKLPELLPVFQEQGISVYLDKKVRNIREAFQVFFSQAHPGPAGRPGRSYVALQPFLTPDEETTSLLQALRTKIQLAHRMATTLGYGPRFLHSTGQLHKGDAGHGLFIQFTAHLSEDAAIPDEPGSTGSSINFSVLKNAQALGDRQALLDNNRKVLRFDLGNDIAGALKYLLSAL